MKKSTKEDIIKKLNCAQFIIDDAFAMLTESEQEKCEYFANLSCNIDEALAEIDNL